MPDLTAELNLPVALDDDDTADYLTLSLADALEILDGLFNAATGHNHNGAHQGQNLTLVDMAGDLPFTRITGQIAAAQLLVETVFEGTRTSQGANYVVVAPIMWVFCTAAIQVTLPAAAATHRPITVAAVTGNSTVIAAAGSVIGGSVNLTTGAIQNGVVNQGEAITYKSDGTNWRAV
jgi:hypothetical protein